MQCPIVVTVVLTIFSCTAHKHKSRYFDYHNNNLFVQNAQGPVTLIAIFFRLFRFCLDFCRIAGENCDFLR